MVKASNQGKAMWPFLAIASIDNQRRIVLLGKEFKRRWVFEGMNIVFLVELDHKRPFN